MHDVRARAQHPIKALLLIQAALTVQAKEFAQFVFGRKSTCMVRDAPLTWDKAPEADNKTMEDVSASGAIPTGGPGAHGRRRRRRP